MWLIMTKSCGNGLTGRVFEEVFGKNSERILDPIKQIHYIGSIRVLAVYAIYYASMSMSITVLEFGLLLTN